MDLDTNSYKLYYFNENNNGMVIRAILTYFNCNFEDIKLTLKQWKDINKENFEFNNLPVLEIINESENKETEYLSQWFSIELYLAKKYNLINSNDLKDEYRNISLICAKKDLLDKCNTAFNPKNEMEKENQEKNIDNLIKEVLPLYCKVFNERLKVFSEKFSLAHIITTVVFYHIFFHPARKQLLEPILKFNGKKVHELVESVKNKELKEFFEKYYLIEKPYI